MRVSIQSYDSRDTGTERKYAKGSVGLQHFMLHSFLLWANHTAFQLQLSPPLPLGLGLGSRQWQSLEIQGHWGWKRHAKGNTGQQQDFVFHSFLLWASCTTTQLQLCSPLQSRLGLGLREWQSQGKPELKDACKGKHGTTTRFCPSQPTILSVSPNLCWAVNTEMLDT